MRPFIRTCLSLLVLALQAQAFSPALNLVNPRGGQRGTELTINLYGERLFEPEEIIFYKPGITVKSLEKIGNEYKRVRAVITIAPDAELGEHPMRLRGKGGVSYMRTFWVGQFPTVMEKESNNEFTAPQDAPFNHTVQGVADKEDAWKQTEPEWIKIEARRKEISERRKLIDQRAPHLAKLDQEAKFLHSRYHELLK